MTAVSALPAEPSSAPQRPWARGGSRLEPLEPLDATDRVS